MGMSQTAMADVLEIQALLATYVFALDEKDFDALDSVFTPDASFDYTATGGVTGDWKTIKPWLQAALARFPVTQHLVGLPRIRLDGDKATCATMLFNPMLVKHNGKDVLFFIGATYRDDLVRTKEGWRITRRVETDPWMKDLPSDFVPEPAHS
ncbi:MAG: nuclear transport factor 2 family protein [Hyphomonadaceae bacterium]|nr:nuclear transport factor 2 family protein [Hyphomonadaceae bacterium]